MMADNDDLYLRQFGQPTGFYVGLDLGMARDYSAIVVNELRTPLWSIDKPYHLIRWAHRFRLGTKYGAVAREVRLIIEQLPARAERPRLFADSTGVGKAVSDLLRDEGLNPFDVTLTGGANWGWSGSSISLPKSLLASTLSVELQSGNIIISGSLPMKEQLVRELDSFRISKTATGHDQFGSRTESDHDDLVIALGLAVWGAANGVAAMPITRFL